MKLKKARERAKLLTNTIYFVGDQDECSMKHLGHGVAMMVCGKDPSVQENYVDYKNAGFSREFSIYEDKQEDCVFVESGFQNYIWKELKEMYDEHGEALFYGNSGVISYVDFYKEYYS